jgi:hypothetical protein
MSKTHDIMTKLSDTVHDIGSHDRVTPFLMGTISGFFIRYRDKILDIGPDIADLPFLDGRDIEKSSISCRKSMTSPTMLGSISGYTDKYTDIVPYVLKRQYTDIVFWQISAYYYYQGRYFTCCAAAPRRPH